MDTKYILIVHDTSETWMILTYSKDPILSEITLIFDNMAPRRDGLKITSTLYVLPPGIQNIGFLILKSEFSS